MTISRRQFLRLVGSSTTSVVIATHLKVLYGRAAQVPTLGYGPLQSDPNRLLDLPIGFQYRVLSKAGDLMNDGSLLPGAQDGMAAFINTQGDTVLIRNHELSTNARIGVLAKSRRRQYDPRGKGGATTMVISPDRRLIRQYASLAGTVRNCGGGATPWGSWISCEEDTSTPPGSFSKPISRPHGYNFEIPITATGPVFPLPLKAMGRFTHEAIAVDPRTGIVYQTEDRGDGLLYRFIPDLPGALHVGGKLEALRIQEYPQANTRRGFPVGQPLAVDWVPIEDVDPAEDTVRREGFNKGAAQFTRGEGICYSDGSLYFVCTTGGEEPFGQIWRYTPGQPPDLGGALELFVQPDDPSILDFPDNLIMAPSGDLMVCEDGRGDQFVVGVTPNGEIYPFAHNALNQSEFAGICFSPDGRTMFLNIYSPGVTFAIWPEGERW
ncbi:MAG: DUF839 domain-containing protein [Leptolyngbyaceae cyanobacterium MO_188.B28]|nr:DUF839 domain-containing protein [Leptolyngbyaceae cyanobacterium MO_188.B28]